MLPSELFGLVPLGVLLPVAGLLVNLIFGGRLGEKAVGAIASSASGLAFVVSVLLAYAVWAGNGVTVVVPFADWIQIGALNVPWAFRVDTLSVTMMLVVSGVGTLIHIYAIGYMHEDVRYKDDPGRFRRFFVYLNLFIALMMVLVSGDSYLMLFVGWEGVALCSYLLIGFWYEMDTLGRASFANALAAKKAMIANRIGDFGFLLAAFTMFWAFKSLSFDTVFAQSTQVAPAYDPGHHPLSADRGDRQVRPAAALRLAAGRHGRSDPGLGADPCGHDGDCRCLPGGPLRPALQRRACGPDDRGPGRRHYRALRRHHRGRAV